jgi:hypothetical protein
MREKMKTIKLTYNLKSTVQLEFDESGDLTSLFIDGNDRTQRGDSIDHVLAAIYDAGHNIQEDISIAFIKLQSEGAYGEGSF